MLLLNPYLLDPPLRLDNWRAWENENATCLICNGKIEGYCGIICGNFGICENQGQLCQGVYHARCYRQHEQDAYPVLAIQDLDDSIMDDSKMVEDDPKRFQVARDGVHMMVLFQCDTCQFMNVRKLLPCPGNAQDELLMKCLCRVIFR